MNEFQKPWLKASVLILGLGCNVESKSHNSGGVGDQASAGAGGVAESGDQSQAGSPARPVQASAGAGGAFVLGTAGAAGVSSTPKPAFPRGVAVVLSDYLSTQIALSDLEGNTLSESFISTASTQTSGLAFALSGDVVLPSSPPASGRVVLLDRYATNVITWIDPKTAAVLGQLAVGTGFESNPHDYVEVDERLAWVSRWGQNGDPGQQDHDTGGDLLVIDTESFEIVDSIVIEPEEDLPPRPSRMTLIGDEVVVSLDRISLDWTTTGESRLVAFSVADKDQTWSLGLDGLKACSNPVPDTGRAQWLVVCTGAVNSDGTVESLDQSALVILDFSSSPPKELQRISAEQIAGEPLQPEVAVAADGFVLLKTQTTWGGTTNNRWLAYDLDNDATTTLLEARPDADGNGQGWTFGGMECAPGCSSLCLMADADRGVLQRLEVSSDGEFELLEPVEVETAVGLPPIGLGQR